MTHKNHTRILIITLLSVTALILGGCAFGFPKASGSQALSSEAGQNLRVHFIDVGQGDSILAESEGRFMLVDGGENDQAQTVVNYLKQAGVTRLDYVIGTHPHSDHIGGLDKVIDTFDIGTVILPPV